MAKRKNKVVKKVKSSRKIDTATKTVLTTPYSDWLVNNKVALAVFAISMLAFYIFSYMSPGFYQQDEVAHFNNMKSFWYNPNAILGNWAKTGYKLIYALPSLLGSHFVTIVNCAMAAFAGYISYLIAKNLGSKLAILAGIVVATQPMFFELSFRNYSEFTTAVLLAGAVWSHYRSKFHLATFLLAFVCTIRQEMLPLLAAYGVFLMINKRWLSIVIGSIPILFVNIWGAIKNDDPFYFVSSLINKSAELGKEYPRQGFWHYFSTAEAIYGGIAILLFIVYLATRKWKVNMHWVLVIPIFYFFGIHVLFATESLNIGPATGGNLRYMTVITPLIAAAGVLGLETLRRMENKKIPMIAVAVVTLITAIYWTYENNNIKLTEERNWTPLLIVVLTAAIIFLVKNKMKDSIVVGLLALVGIINLSSSATTFDITPEEKAIEKAAKFYKTQIKMTDSRSGKFISDDDHVYFDHTVFEYFTGKCRYEFPGQGKRPRKTAVDEAPVGSIIVFDTHYSYRPKSHKEPTPETYFSEQPEKYKAIYQEVSTDRRFKIVMYKKIAM